MPEDDQKPEIHANSIFSTQMARATGYLVLEAAQAEDTIGELITLTQRLSGAETNPAGWWTSGEQLENELRALGDPELESIALLYSRLHLLRNSVVHGLTLDDAGTIIKREKITKKSVGAAEYQFAQVDLEARDRIAADFRRLERMAADAVSDALGLPRTTASGLPQRVTPCSWQV